MTDLYAALQPILDKHESFHRQQDEEEEEGKERPVQLAIMGLPNVVSSQSSTVQIRECIWHGHMLPSVHCPSLINCAQSVSKAALTVAHVLVLHAPAQ